MRVEANETIGRRLFYNPILFSRANVFRNFIPSLSLRGGSDCKWNRDKGRRDRHAPDKTFRVSGRPIGKVLHAIHVWHSSVGRNPPEYTIGQEVTLHYDPNNPDEVILEEEKLMVYVFGGMGLIFLLLSVWEICSSLRNVWQWLSNDSRPILNRKCIN